MRKKLSLAFESIATDVSPQVYNSFDIIGDIAITKLPEKSRMDAKTVAQAIMSRHKNVATVFSQSSAVSGEFRLRKLVHLAGENKTKTVHKESGCSFVIDIESAYFSPRLLEERIRIAKLVQPFEIVVNMFAGVGCFSIIIARRVPTSKVYSIDINPYAVKLMEENIRLNRVFGKVIPVLGDSKLIVETQLQQGADRVLMPLPEKALEFLPTAVSAVKSSGGWVHCHIFEHACSDEDPIRKAVEEISVTLTSAGMNFAIPFSRIVRSIGPNWYQIATDIRIKS